MSIETNSRLDRLEASEGHFSVEDERCLNLCVLGVGLWQLSAWPRYDRFNMRRYAASKGESLSFADFCAAKNRAIWRSAHCGTAACALGHGPLFGIAHSPRLDSAHTWTSYSYNFLPLFYGVGRSPEWAWLFSESWALVNGWDDILAAVRRIAYYVTYALAGFKDKIAPVAEWLVFPRPMPAEVSRVLDEVMALDLEVIVSRMRGRLCPMQLEGIAWTGRDI